MMKAEQISAAEECATLSLAGSISFPDVVRRLSGVGIERYHADYCRMEKTYYLPNGTSHVVPLGATPAPIAGAFSADAVVAAIRSSQKGEIQYQEFLRRTMAAGCVGYFVQIAGRRALYFGRNGELHTEWFPGAQPAP